MKKKVAIILNSLAIVLVFACTIALSFAWYTNSNDIDVSLQGGSAGGYFRGGSGTATDPYEIANSRHMYNFAWLQNNGKYVDSKGDQTKMYFELVNADGNNGVIDMEGVAIPPIGNDELPFIGEFNGNGCTISNLIVSTHYDVIYNGDVLREDNYAFSNAVGLFGMTGTGSVIKNFILNDPIVEVYDGNDTIYDASGAKVVGIAIGYVENIASSIGIIGGTLANRRQENYSSYNNIIGSMSETAKGNMNITGETTGNNDDRDKGYFIPKVIYQKAAEQTNAGTMPNYAESVNTNTNATGNVLVFKDTGNPVMLTKSNDLLGLGAFSLIADTADANIRSNAYDPNIIRFYASSNNDIDSCQNVDGLAAVQNTAIYSEASTEKYDIDITKGNGYYSSQLTSSSTQTEVNAAKKKDEVLSNVKFVNERIYSLDYSLYFNKSLNASSSAVDVYYEDGVTSPTTITSDRNAIITFEITKASSDNPAQVFMIAGGNKDVDKRTFGIYREEDYTGSISYKKKYPKQILDLPSEYNVTACYFNITESGTYFLGSTGSSMRLFFLSVLGVAEGQESTGTYEEDKMISGIDFITSDVTIIQTEGEEQYQFTNISDINQTNTFVYTKVKASFNSNMNGVTLYFKREDETISALLIEIYPNKDNLTTTGSGTCTVTVVNQDLTLE